MATYEATVERGDVGQYKCGYCGLQSIAVVLSKGQAQDRTFLFDDEDAKRRASEAAEATSCESSSRPSRCASRRATWATLRE